MRGNLPTPTPILAARGSARANARRDEPRPPVEAPKPPDHLSDAARKEWRTIVPYLLAMRVLAKSDRTQLALYCVAYARWVEAEQQLAENGVVVKSPNGYPIQNPYLAVANKAMEQANKFGAELGLSPAARARLHVAPNTNASNAKARFFDRGPSFADPDAPSRREMRIAE